MPLRAVDYLMGLNTNRLKRKKRGKEEKQGGPKIKGRCRNP